MTHLINRDMVLGYEKVRKVYDWLNSDYGFEREMENNFVSNAKYWKVHVDELKLKVRKELRRYAAEHAKLPVYNRAQWLARQAAVAVGREQFETARNYLRTLLAMCPNEEAFKTAPNVCYVKNVVVKGQQMSRASLFMREEEWTEEEIFERSSGSTQELLLRLDV